VFATAAALTLMLGAARYGSATAIYPTESSSQLNVSLTPVAFLYRLDPESGSFITIPLPLNSAPAAVKVISGSESQQIWFSEPGLGRIGRVVFTSSLDYTLTEFVVGGNPVSLDVFETDVWFTLPRQNQIGHLDVSSGAVTRYDLPSTQADPADIAIDASDRVWVTERAVDRLAMTSPAVTITEYLVPGSGLMPEGVLPVEDGSIWFAAGAAGYVWRLTPENEYYLAVPMGLNSYPYRLALDGAGRIWVTLRDANQLAMIVPGTSPYTVLYTIPTANSQPTVVGVDSSGRVYFAEQSIAQVSRLIVTPAVSFAEYPLPSRDLKLSGLAVAGDGSVWAVAYRDVYQIHLPVVMQDYDAAIPPFAVQMYGSIGASTGLTQAVAAGVKWIRVPVVWSDIEPVNTTPDNYHWSSLDASFQAAWQAGIHLIFTIDANPSWAARWSSGPVSNTADLQEFVGAVVARYPGVEYWEFYNEPDRVGRFGLNGAGYAAMLQSVYPTVKSANPSAKVVIGGVAMDWFIEDGGPFDQHFLEDVLSNCAGPCFDVANFHYYPGYRDRWEPYGRDIIGKAAYVRQILASRGYERPVINTEAGWPAGTISGSPELSARYVPKLYARTFAAGLALTNWYAMLDTDSSLPGLLDSNMTPRLAYTAYQTLTSLTSFARYVRAIPPAETGSAQIEGYQFTVPGTSGRKRLDVYWYDCPSMYNYVTGYPTDCTNVAPLVVNASRIAVIDKMGARVILNDADDGLTDGKIAIPGGVGSSPIYVDYAP